MSPAVGSRALPGKYAANYVYWDASAYYYTLISKLPSPIVMVYKEGAVFMPFVPENRQQDALSMLEREQRWRSVLDAIGPDKGLRNALLGVMQGSYKERISYSRNHPEGFVTPGRAGPLRAAALLVVRAGHELTQLENLGGESIWGHTDCAVLPEGIEPTVWRSKGFTVASKATGDAHIIDTGSYRIGERKSRDYFIKSGAEALGAIQYADAEDNEGMAVVQRYEGTTIPEVQYHRSFL